MPQGDQLYSVGGVLLPRPFKIRRLGHFGVNVADMGAGLGFYRDLLGFKVSDEIDFGRRAPDKLKDIAEPKGYFTRYGTDHHAFVLFNPRGIDGLDPPRPRGGQTNQQITLQ